MGDIWSDKAWNPNAFGEKEKQLYVEVEPLIRALLDELKQDGKVEIMTLPAEIEQLRSVIERYHVSSTVHNFIIDLYKDKEIPPKFLSVNKSFGLNDEILTGIYLEVALFGHIVNVELFKLLILFHLKDVERDVSKFSQTMKEHAPTGWSNLKPYLDSAFRNAIGHCTFSVRGKKVVIYGDAKLVPTEEMELDQFMIRLKRANVIFICLFNVLAELKRQGWFTF